MHWMALNLYGMLDHRTGLLPTTAVHSTANRYSHESLMQIDTFLRHWHSLHLQFDVLHIKHLVDASERNSQLSDYILGIFLLPLAKPNPDSS